MTNSYKHFDFFALLDHFHKYDISYRCGHNNKLVFAPGEIDSLQFVDSEAKLTLNLLGLTGVQGCLPLQLRQYTSKQDCALNDLLDIIHHRFYILLFKIWQQQSPHIIAKQFNCEYGLFNYFTQAKPGTLLWLKHAINKFMPYVTYIIQDGITWHNIECASMPLMLNQTFLLGKRIASNQHNIHIEFAALTVTQISQIKRLLLYCLSYTISVRFGFQFDPIICNKPMYLNKNTLPCRLVNHAMNYNVRMIAYN